VNRSFAGVRVAVLSLATVAALLVGPAVPASASAGERYVAPSGSDSASCTRSAPCGSLERAYRLAVPGQTVRLAGGTYSDTSLRLDPAKRAAQDVVIAPAAGATPRFSAPLHIGAHNVELRGLQLQDTLHIDPTAQNLNLRGLNIKNFEIFSSGGQAPRNISFIGGSAGPSVDDNNRIASNGTSTTASPTNILIDGMRIHDFTLSPGSDAHVECLQVWAADGLTIRNSRFRNCEVFDVFLQKLPGGAAVTPTNILIENNFMQCCRSGYYAIRMADHPGTQWRNVMIRNNSFDKEINPDGGVPYSNVKILGNIGPRLSFFTGWTGGEGSKPAGITANYNVWYSGSKVGAQDKVAPSGYLNAAAGDLHLKAGAAAINSGQPTDHPGTDIDGDARPFGAAPDAGADEWTPGGLPRPPRPTPPPGGGGPTGNPWVRPGVGVFAAGADASIRRAQPRRNSGRSRRLRAGARPAERFLVRFSVSGIGSRRVKSARLRLYVANGSSKGGVLRRVSNRWKESRVSWRRAPRVLGPQRVARKGRVKRGRYVEFDVSRIVTKDGSYSVRVSSRARDRVAYNSREAARNRPQLVVRLDG
jgi:hypothetical protein